MNKISFLKSHVDALYNSFQQNFFKKLTIVQQQVMTLGLAAIAYLATIYLIHRLCLTRKVVPAEKLQPKADVPNVKNNDAPKVDTPKDQQQALEQMKDSLKNQLDQAKVELDEVEQEVAEQVKGDKPEELDYEKLQHASRLTEEDLAEAGKAKEENAKAIGEGEPGEVEEDAGLFEEANEPELKNQDPKDNQVIKADEEITKLNESEEGSELFEKEDDLGNSSSSEHEQKELEQPQSKVVPAADQQKTQLEATPNPEKKQKKQQSEDKKPAAPVEEGKFKEGGLVEGKITVPAEGAKQEEPVEEKKEAEGKVKVENKEPAAPTEEVQEKELEEAQEGEGEVKVENKEPAAPTEEVQEKELEEAQEGEGEVEVENKEPAVPTEEAQEKELEEAPEGEGEVKTEGEKPAALTEEAQGKKLKKTTDDEDEIEPENITPTTNKSKIANAAIINSPPSRPRASKKPSTIIITSPLSKQTSRKLDSSNSIPPLSPQGKQILTQTYDRNKTQGIVKRYGMYGIPLPGLTKPESQLGSALPVPAQAPSISDSAPIDIKQLDTLDKRKEALPALLQQKQYEDVREVCKNILGEDENNIEAYMHYGIAAFEEGSSSQLQLAWGAFNDVLSRDPENSAAIEFIEKILSQAPNCNQLADFGWYLCSIGRLEEGFKKISEAVEKAPKNGYPYGILAKATETHPEFASKFIDGSDKKEVEKEVERDALALYNESLRLTPKSEKQTQEMLNANRDVMMRIVWRQNPILWALQNATGYRLSELGRYGTGKK